MNYCYAEDPLTSQCCGHDADGAGVEAVAVASVLMAAVSQVVDQCRGVEQSLQSRELQ